MMESFAIILLRTTAFTIVAASAAKLIFRRNRLSPRIQRIIAVLVLCQGWMVLPVVLEVPLETESRVARIAEISETALQPLSSTEELPTPIHTPELDIAPPVAVATSIPLTSVVWSCGVIACAVLFVARYGSLVHHVPFGDYPSNRQWLEEWSQVTIELNVSKRVQLRISDKLGPLLCMVPFVYLVLCPRRLWTILDSTQRKAVLTHELAHVKRYDLWKSIGIRILALPQWFNPMAWMIVRAFDEAAEWACDDLVMSCQKSGGTKSYPLTLVQIAELAHDRFPATAAARGGVLDTRVRRLVEPSITEERKMLKTLVLLMLCSFMLFQSIRVEAVATEAIRDNRESTASPAASLDDNRADEPEEIKALRKLLPDHLETVWYDADRSLASSNSAASFTRELDSLKSKRAAESHDQEQQTDSEDSRILAKVYDVPDLVMPPGQPEFSTSGRGTPLKLGANFDTLNDLITSTVAPHSWKDVGGEGEIEAFAPNHSLVISQSQDVHDEIAALLKTLRQLSDKEVVLRLTYLRIPATVSGRLGIQGKRLAALSSAEMETLLDAVQENIYARALSGSIARLYNGQSVVLETSSEGPRFSIHAVMDNETKAYRLATFRIGDDGKMQPVAKSEVCNGKALLFAFPGPPTALVELVEGEDDWFILLTGQMQPAKTRELQDRS